MKRILSIVLMSLIIVSSIIACSNETDSVVSSVVDNVSEDSRVITDETSADSSDYESVSSESSLIESDHSSKNDASNDISEDSSDATEESYEISVESDVDIDDTSDDVSVETSDDTSEPENPNINENKEIVSLFDSSDLNNYASPFLPSFAPFSLYDTTLFSDSVITSVSFPFDSLASGYTVDSDKLYMPIYVVKSNFTTAKSECTVENGKKIVLDFTGKLSNIKRGDWLTVDDLEIKVAPDETLAFGDTDMAVLPMFLRDNGTYGFWNRIFGEKGGNNHSLIFKIHGYKNNSGDSEIEDDGKKYISFLGDSISTYSGWSNNTSHNNSIGGNAVWYPNNNYAGANLAVQDAWWYKVANQIGYEIAVNNSWSGSVVNNVQTYNVRAKNLHNTLSGAKPDIVVIFMGVNDYAAGATVGNYDGKSDPPVNPTNFSEAYGRTIKNILDKYEGVEVYCCTFLPDRKRFSGSNNTQGIDESSYNDAIRTIAANMGVNLIDLYNNSGITPSNISQFTVDKLHPNKNGMEKVAKTIIDVIKKR